MNIVVTLRPAELKALVQSANKERRSPTDQASYLLASALASDTAETARTRSIDTEPVAA